MGGGGRGKEREGGGRGREGEMEGGGRGRGVRGRGPREMGGLGKWEEEGGEGG